MAQNKQLYPLPKDVCVDIYIFITSDFGKVYYIYIDRLDPLPHPLSCVYNPTSIIGRIGRDHQNPRPRCQRREDDARHL